jgi:hypothetical protein
MKAAILIVALLLLLSDGCTQIYIFLTLEPGTAWGVPCLGDLKPKNVRP